MKRFALGAGLLAAAAVALPLSPTWAEDAPTCTKQSPYCSGGTCTKGCQGIGGMGSCGSDGCPYGYAPVAEPIAAPKDAEHKPVAAVVDDLVAVLAETKSKDVYTATVVALAHLGADARPALPDVLKNAERLGVLEGAFASGGCKCLQCEVILDAVAAIAHGPDNPHHAHHHGYAACPYHSHTGGTVYSQPATRKVETCDQPAECPKEQLRKPHQRPQTLSEGSSGMLER
jgi:hypothetical protein